MVIQCVSYNSLHENVKEGGGEHTALSYSDCGSEPVPCVVIKVDCAGGLVIEVRKLPHTKNKMIYFDNLTKCTHLY